MLLSFLTVYGQEAPRLQPVPSVPPVVIGETPETGTREPAPLPPTIARPDDEAQPPSNPLPRPVLLDAEEAEERPRPSLGIVAEERPDKTGLTIIDIRDGSPADTAGVRLGDRLTRLNGQQTRTIEDVSKALSTLRAGDPTTIEVFRSGSLYELKAVMSDAPPPSVDATENDDSSIERPRSMSRERGVLGISVEDAGRLQTGSSALRGALITAVVSGSPAEASGLQPGDVVVSIDGRVMYGARELTGYMQSARGGDQVEVGYYRGRVLHRAQVTLAGSGEAMADATDLEPGVIPVPRDFPGGALPGRFDSELDERGPIVIRPGSSVGEILEGVGKTIDNFMGPRSGRGILNPQAESSRRSSQAGRLTIPTPRAETEERPIPVPPPVSSSDTDIPKATTGNESAEVLELRRQMQVMMQRMEMLERELEKAKQTQ
ncbi:MAG: PDZ domain-containing protein [Pirellulaceae bacterium]